SGLRRGYLLLGTVIFGIATVILLPTGIYQALSYLILPADQGVFRQGAGDSLPGGVVTLVVWLIYLWLVVRDVRSAPAMPATTACGCYSRGSACRTARPTASRSSRSTSRRSSIRSRRTPRARAFSSSARSCATGRASTSSCS